MLHHYGNDAIFQVRHMRYRRAIYWPRLYEAARLALKQLVMK